MFSRLGKPSHLNRFTFSCLGSDPTYSLAKWCWLSTRMHELWLVGKQTFEVVRTECKVPQFSDQGVVLLLNRETLTGDIEAYLWILLLSLDDWYASHADQST